VDFSHHWETRKRSLPGTAVKQCRAIQREEAADETGCIKHHRVENCGQCSSTARQPRSNAKKPNDWEYIAATHKLPRPASILLEAQGNSF
jgi:hypothetical protein